MPGDPRVITSAYMFYRQGRESEATIRQLAEAFIADLKSADLIELTYEAATLGGKTTRCFSELKKWDGVEHFFDNINQVRQAAEVGMVRYFELREEIEKQPSGTI